MFATQGFEETPWMQRADIRVQERPIGAVEVVYSKTDARRGRWTVPQGGDPPHPNDRGPDRPLHAPPRHERPPPGVGVGSEEPGSPARQGNWRIVLDLLASTDPDLYAKITHMMLNHLCWSGIEEAEALLDRVAGPARRRTRRAAQR